MVTVAKVSRPALSPEGSGEPRETVNVSSSVSSSGDVVTVASPTIVSLIDRHGRQRSHRSPP